VSLKRISSLEFLDYACFVQYAKKKSRSKMDSDNENVNNRIGAADVAENQAPPNPDELMEHDVCISRY